MPPVSLTVSSFNSLKKVSVEAFERDYLTQLLTAHHVVVMNAGRVEQEGTAKDLYERPQTLFVAGFVGFSPDTFV